MAYSLLLKIDIPEIRRINFNNQTYYSVVDVWKHLSDEGAPAQNYYAFRGRNLWTNSFVVKLALPCRGLAQDPTDCANAEGIFRIVCNMKSEKAEKVRWAMAKALSDKLKQTKGTSLVKFIESIE